MTPSIETVRLLESQRSEAAEVLGRAFHDDPSYVYAEPDSERRARVVPWFMNCCTTFGLMFGEVVTTRGKIEGVAIWLPPRQGPIPDDQAAKAGFGESPSRWGAKAYSRFSPMLDRIIELHHRLVPEPHWYLMILGVDPPRQGQGIGSALMLPVLRRADAEGLPCYLETEVERNLRLYRRHGFEVIHEEELASGGPHAWCMLRRPGNRKSE